MQTKAFGRFDKQILQKYFNEKTFDVYVKRSPLGDEFDRPAVNSKFNLTWECIKYFEDEMLLQINFSHPLWISRDREFKDSLIVNLKDGRYFKSNYTRSKRALQQVDYEELDMSLADPIFDQYGFEFDTELSFDSLVLETYIVKQNVIEKDLKFHRLVLAMVILIYILTIASFILGLTLFRINWILLLSTLLSLQVIVHLTLLDLTIS